MKLQVALRIVADTPKQLPGGTEGIVRRISGKPDPTSGGERPKSIPSITEAYTFWTTLAIQRISIIHAKG